MTSSIHWPLRRRRCVRAATAALLLLAMASLPPAAEAQDDDPDLDLNLSQPDFTLVSLPTTVRLPRFKSAFRVTHRFTRPLGDGDLGDLAEDLFGIDSGAFIGLEYRFGLMRGLQAGLLRTNDRTIQFFSQYNLLNQSSGAPVGLGVLASIDGTNNFRDSYSPGVQVILSRELGAHGALYLAPAYVNNSAPLPEELVDDNDTVLVGLGARLRLRRNTYVTVEGSPRLTGYAPNVALVTVGLEQRAGGHLFQLTFSNGLGTTLAQVARGGTAKDDWYIGFNLSRKFY